MSRWKGENVATTEVSDIISALEFVQEANVYGVRVPGLLKPRLLRMSLSGVTSLMFVCVFEGHEGRIGMAALKLMEGMEFDRTETFNHVCRFLPGYARPRFIRIQVEFSPSDDTAVFTSHKSCQNSSLRLIK